MMLNRYVKKSIQCSQTMYEICYKKIVNIFKTQLINFSKTYQNLVLSIKNNEKEMTRRNSQMIDFLKAIKYNVVHNRKKTRLRSVAGSVILITGRPDFEDGLKTRVQLVLRCTRTTLQVKDRGAFVAGLDQGIVQALEPAQNQAS